MIRATRGIHLVCNGRLDNAGFIAKKVWKHESRVVQPIVAPKLCVASYIISPTITLNKQSFEFCMEKIIEVVFKISQCL